MKVCDALINNLYELYNPIEKGDIVVHVNSKDLKIVEEVNSKGTTLRDFNGVGRLFFSHEVAYMLYEQYRIASKKDGIKSREQSSPAKVATKGE